MMEKHVHLMLTDLHFSCDNLSNRIDYLGEEEFIKRKIIDTIMKYKNSGCKVYGHLLGDVFGRGYIDKGDGVVIGRAINDNNFFVILYNLLEECLVTIGNHEFSYTKGNPFYSLITSIDSDKIKNIRNVPWSPKGVIPLIKVKDSFDDGEVTFHYNHYGTPISHGLEDRVNIALFHQDVICTDIYKEMIAQVGLKVFVNKKNTLKTFDGTDIYRNFKYCFFGHFHKVYGRWRYSNEKYGVDTMLYYLGSLLRTAHDEVDDNFLERNIPAVIIADGKFIEVEDNLFDLWSRSESVNEIKIKEKQIKDKKVREKKEQLEIEYTNNDLVENVLSRCTSTRQVAIISDILETGNSSYCNSLITKCDKYKYM